MNKIEIYKILQIIIKVAILTRKCSQQLVARYDDNSYSNRMGYCLQERINIYLF